MFLKSSIPKYLLLIFGLVLLYTKPTDADLVDTKVLSGHTYTATTLDFSNRSTANSSFKEDLFNVGALAPGGWDVRAIKIKKDGKLGFNYTFSSDIKSQNSECAYLNIKVFSSNFEQTFNDKLSALIMTDSLTDSSFKEYLLVLTLDSNNSVSGTCLFDIVFTTQSNGGFSDTEKLSNQVVVQGGG